MANTLNHGLRSGTVALILCKLMGFIAAFTWGYVAYAFILAIAVDLFYTKSPVLHDDLHKLYLTAPWWSWPFLWPMILHDLEDLIYHRYDDWWPHLWWLDIGTMLLNIALVVFLLL